MLNINQQYNQPNCLGSDQIEHHSEGNYVRVMKVMIGRLVDLFEALQTPSLGLFKALQGEREFMLKWSLSLTLALSFWSTYKCPYHSNIG